MALPLVGILKNLQNLVRHFSGAGRVFGFFGRLWPNAQICVKKPYLEIQVALASFRLLLASAGCRMLPRPQWEARGSNFQFSFAMSCHVGCSAQKFGNHWPRYFWLCWLITTLHDRGLRSFPVLQSDILHTFPPESMWMFMFMIYISNKT